MAVVEVIYAVAAALWILVVVAVLCIGVRGMVKLRSHRRRINRLIDGVRLPLQLGSVAVLFLRWCEQAGRPYTATAGKTALVLQRLIGDFPDSRIAFPPARRRR